MLGNIGKDSKYLNRIKDATAHIADHPRHHGIKMQAHHLISADGVKRSGLGKELAQYGYDINLLPNLAFLPSTLQGACHLGVQPHRGNHLTPIEQNEGDDDSLHPSNYHEMVMLRILELRPHLTKNCPAEDLNHRNKIQSEMNKISEKILKLIQNNPSKAPLTKIWNSFSTGNEVGCSGVDSVNLHGKQKKACPVGRNHMQPSKGQAIEGITYPHSKTAYVLKVGK